jgi:hypothetical protein
VSGAAAVALLIVFIGAGLAVVVTVLLVASRVNRR